MKKINIEDFIEKAKQIHGDKYDYSKVEYEGTDKKVCIICPKHGEFWQTPYVHNNLKCGCPLCGHERTNALKRSSKEHFIEKAKEVHGDKYDYSKVKYVNNHTEVRIICPEHGEFWQKPYVHLKGSGCHKCSLNKRKSIFSDGREKFIEKAKKVHNDKYDYSKVNYVNARTKVCIICPEHGEFWQEPFVHIVSKYGCPKCGKKAASTNEALSTEDFIEKAKQIHGGKYDYSEAQYKASKSLIKIICPKHGEFWQTPDSHLHGSGCQRCSNVKSSGEEEIFSILKGAYNDEIETRDRSVIKPYELDILIPKLNIAIEYNGLKWHSEEFQKDKYYHLKKMEMCKEKNIKLISIFEDEWLHKKDIVINKILHITNLIQNKKKIYARKCKISLIDKKVAENFLEKYHIQGKSSSTLNYGCFYDETIVGVMSFKKTNNENEWELTRFATNYDYICCGVGGKLFKTFVNDKKPKLVKSFADRRWTFSENDNFYTKIGFKLSDILKPDYRYVVGNQRVHKFNFRKQILHRKYKFPLSMTEKEMVEKMKIYKIWDCGLLKYVWKPNS